MTILVKAILFMVIRKVSRVVNPRPVVEKKRKLHATKGYADVTQKLVSISVVDCAM